MHWGSVRGTGLVHWARFGSIEGPGSCTGPRFGSIEGLGSCTGPRFGSFEGPGSCTGPRFGSIEGPYNALFPEKRVIRPAKARAITRKGAKNALYLGGRRHNAWRPHRERSQRRLASPYTPARYRRFTWRPHRERSQRRLASLYAPARYRRFTWCPHRERSQRCLARSRWKGERGAYCADYQLVSTTDGLDFDTRQLC